MPKNEAVLLSHTIYKNESSNKLFRGKKTKNPKTNKNHKMTIKTNKQKTHKTKTKTPHPNKTKQYIHTKAQKQKAKPQNPMEFILCRHGTSPFEWLKKSTQNRR